MPDSDGRARSAPTSPVANTNPLPSILTPTRQTNNVGNDPGSDRDTMRASASRKLRFTTMLEVEDTKRGDGRKSRGWEAGRSDPGTPNISETAAQIRRTISLASLDTLLTIAQDDMERERFGQEIKSMLWRDERETRKMPNDAERALVLAARRGLRSFVLAYTVRAGINLLLLLMRTFRRRRLKWALLRHAILGKEPFRFGAMIGTFTFLNTLTLHLLRLAPPLSYLRKRLLRIMNGDKSPLTYGPPSRFSAPDEENGYFMGEEDTGERRWQAAIAGAVGSLGLLWEDRGRRIGVSQQMFVRGLQASYNQVSARTGYKVPFGSIIVFGLSCGQIMFAFLLSPSTIPPEYNSWIQSASRVQKSAIRVNRGIARKGAIDIEAAKSALSHKYITSANASRLRELIEAGSKGIVPDGVPCAAIHPWLDSCRYVLFERYFEVFRFALPVYSALHFIPMLILRRKHFMKDPLSLLGKATLGTFRSSSFLSAFVLIYQGLLCARTQTLEGFFGKIPVWLRVLLRRKEVFWLIGFSTCLSLFVEEPKRRAELAAYVLPRALESGWATARRRAWVPIVPFGESIMGAAAMAMIMDAYKHEPQALSTLLRKVIFQVVGPA